MKNLDLQALAHALPIHAEEGAFRELIAEDRLRIALAKSGAVDAGWEALAVIRRLFEPGNRS